MSLKVCIPTPVFQPRNLYTHSVSTLGHLGKFTLSLHWMNLGNQPVEVLIEDVYLLVTPSPQGEEDPEDEANRAHAAKMERLENAELLHMGGQSEVATGSCSLPSFRSCVLSAGGPSLGAFSSRESRLLRYLFYLSSIPLTSSHVYPDAVEDSQKSQGLIASLITKIVNNLQVTIKNVHIRYEDKLSVPGVSLPDFNGSGFLR